MNYEQGKGFDSSKSSNSNRRQVKSASSGGGNPAGAGQEPQSSAGGKDRFTSSVDPGSRADRLAAQASSRKSGGGQPLQKTAPGSRAAARAAKARKRRRLIIMAIAECVTLVFIFAYGYVARRLNLIQRPEFTVDKVTNPELTVEKKEHMKGYWTIAVFGVDSRGKNVSKGTNADVNMICNINLDTGEIKLVSVFRDTYLNISENNTYNKINAAYAQGGPEQAVYAINKNLDLNITDYITFNWKAVADGINILGGVDVEISKAEFHYINSFITETVKATDVGSHQLKKAGMNHLDGIQAVAYGRLRLMDTDFARTERQRKIISLAFEKAKKADYSVLNNILVTVLPHVATNLKFEELTEMALSVGKYNLGETTGFPGARGDVVMGKKGDCVIPTTLESNVKQLHKFLYDKDDYEPTDTVKKISAKIAADSGMYKEGKYIDHVPTDGGYIPKPTEPKTTAEETDESETNEGMTDESSSGTDESETDEYGRPVTRPTDESRDPSDPSPDGSYGPGDEIGPGTRPTGDAMGPSGDMTRPSSGESSQGTQDTKPDSTTAPGGQAGPGEGPGRPPQQSTSAAEPGAAQPSSGRGPGEGTTATVSPPPIISLKPGGNEIQGPGI